MRRFENVSVAQWDIPYRPEASTGKAVYPIPTSLPPQSVFRVSPDFYLQKAKELEAEKAKEDKKAGMLECYRDM
jgi:hypothetical protein